MTKALELDEWGGTGPVLHLAHANGFPPGTYRKLIESLKSRYRVVTVRTRCMVPGTVPTDMETWDDMAEDLIGALRAARLEGVIGVGHSMGGVATLLASVKAPTLFRGIVALDPVLITGRRAVLLRLLSWVGQRHRVPPASLARRRRERWTSREEAAASYRKKPLFRAFDADCFQDYVAHGLTETPDGGLRLTIPRDWEARVFETSPKDVWRALRSVSVPTLVVRGQESVTLTSAALARVRRALPGVQVDELPGGHLFPLEHPDATVRRVLAFLGALEPGEDAARRAR
ncbi:alpha/beta hydrolase [Myxococcus sp. K15C18031901]|uniref:alpha/beta fold hydrolase n=1 Tax=Myxococcus dinghuensis TaxID=2906761 RepID=UPI0020A78ED7|nr:alpha/beta hydrolase [Myxococcus dinghuensis]MCP3098517.1 alpha/beta hydrolase [Myxococcus dinghuensis]